MAKASDEPDHIDRFLQEHDFPGVDLEVEGIVERVDGLRRRFRAMAEKTLAEFGLAEGEWKVLTHLRLAPPTYRRSAGQLAKRTELSSGAMTNRLDRLEQAGHVRRLPDPGDRRGVLVELTKEGHRAWEEAIGAQAANEALLAAALTEAEKRQLNALLRRLMREFERREQGRSQERGSPKPS
jgi:DNA-binding MarR family transcriptional regulator